MKREGSSLRWEEHARLCCFCFRPFIAVTGDELVGKTGEFLSHLRCGHPITAETMESKVREQDTLSIFVLFRGLREMRHTYFLQRKQGHISPPRPSVQYLPHPYSPCASTSVD